MARTVGIGIQDFEQVILSDSFYVDKTDFIREWWENKDAVTLITRPRRFGKTLTMSMLDHFFSNRYDNQEELFGKLSIWKNEKMRKLAGQYPVIFLSFADIKSSNFSDMKKDLSMIMYDLYGNYSFILDSDILPQIDKDKYRKLLKDFLNGPDALYLNTAIKSLSYLLEKYYGKKVIILLDEYDTPMQEAYVSGYWDDMTAFIRSTFNSAFKTNPSMQRAIMTGITRVSKESIFSDLNNLAVITTSSQLYQTAFGFTEEEVFAGMDEMGMTNREEAKFWYDGFSFGKVTDMYNPWSIINYLKHKKANAYWANTSGNSLIGNLLRKSDVGTQECLKDLLRGKVVRSKIDEEIIFSQLGGDETAIWSLMLASGYLKIVEAPEFDGSLDEEDYVYTMALTNHEVKLAMRRLVSDWFKSRDNAKGKFLKAFASGDLEEMNLYMNDITQNVFSFYDVGNGRKWKAAERFYHGFVIGLMVDLTGKYEIRSNRESGLGRYDVMFFPRKAQDGIIVEFKAVREEKDETLDSAAQSALQQIEEKDYERELRAAGVTTIRKYAFAFDGKDVLIEEWRC